MRPRTLSEFARRVLATVRRIPPGRVATYGDVAEMAGSPRAWRAVGAIMRECRDPSMPCHRVIGASGALGGYGHNLQLKRELLRAEGLEVGIARVRHFDEVHWSGAARVPATPRDTTSAVKRKRATKPRKS